MLLALLVAASGAAALPPSLVAAAGAAAAPPHHARNRAAALRAMPARSKTLARARASMRAWRAPRHTTAAPWEPIYPAAFGADPTGRADSSAAFDAALAALLARGTAGRVDEGGTVDLGGAAIDLQGGDYLISRPLVFPSNYSNFALLHGTLRAAAAFPPGGFLVDVGTAGAFCENWGDSCTENVDLEDLFLDGSQIANGVRFNAVIGVNAGPDMFIANFSSVGVDIEGGHEVELHESWVGKCWYTPPETCWLNTTALANSTGVIINGNDHLLNQVVVFAGLVGVVVNGAASVLTAVHTWSSQVGAVPDAVGIQVNVWQNRLVAPYLDYVPLVLRGSAVTSVTNGFFLCADLLFRPDPNGYPVRGVIISGNEFVCGGSIRADGVGFTGVQDVSVTGNLYDDVAPHRSTSASVTLANSTSPWIFDFGESLIFDAASAAGAIKTVAFSVVAAEGAPFFAAYAQPPVGGRVTVVTDRPVTAVAVTCSVDQSERSAP